MDNCIPEIIRQWLGEQRIENNRIVDTTTMQAAYICGGCQASSANAKGKEPINRKERTQFNFAVRHLEEITLTNWAKDNGLWVNQYDFEEQFSSRKIGQGAEQKVYLHQNGRDVIKANSGSYHGNWLEFFNRLICHSLFFPSTEYITIGFTILDDTFSVIIKQPFALLNQGAPRHIVEPFLKQFGFVRTRNDDYYNGKLGIILEDLHDENIFLLDEQILFIDPVIYFETPEMGLEKNYLFRFPFA